MKAAFAKTSRKQRATIKDMLKFPIFYRPAISPNGKKVAYTKIMKDFREHIPTAPCYIYDCESQSTFQALEAGSEMIWIDDDTYSVIRHSHSGNPRWSDICLIKNLVGEGKRIVSHSGRITQYAPFAKGFVFYSTKPVEQSCIGNFIHVENETSKNAVYYVSIERSLENQQRSKEYFKEENYTPAPYLFEISHSLDPSYHITSFVLAPETKTVYLNCQRGVDSINEDDTACFKIMLDPEAILDAARETNLDDVLAKLSLERIWLPDSFSIKDVSPDGRTLLVQGPVPDHKKQPRHDLWLIGDDETNQQKTKGGYESLRPISEKLDRYILDVHWTRHGIFVLHFEGTRSTISQLFENGDYKTCEIGDVSPGSPFHLTDTGYITFDGDSPDTLPEVYIGKPTAKGWDLVRVTRNTETFSHLDFGTVETIRWTSKDGTEIEGILRKPSDFNPTRKYPLILFPHGGPRGCSILSRLSNDGMRPVHPLLARGVLILEPNYRGGLGRGRDFMELNHNNLGVGDLWDLESGIDYLIAQGFIDEKRIGSMGGSQGGYLSAFIGMHTDRCAAVSVNAGVSSWYLYYISSDMRHSIHLDGTPFDPESREAYCKSAPISAIDRARTPMLIQHGDSDERISVISAHELYRALKHKGVPTELFVLPGMGHGYPFPRENYAVMLQNYRWFCHYLLGEELDLFKDDFGE
ncbi:MAG: S9 family peptidase [Candidatus Thorarchaeota archaeon]|nr:S9 family peptidase [Candidatus Thorarchaeota archaeon]